MLVLVLACAVLFQQSSVCAIGQSTRRALRDVEDVHDINEVENMEDIKVSLMSKLGSACDVTNVLVRMILKETEERTKLALRLRSRLKRIATQLQNVNPEPPPAVPVIAFSARVGAHIQNLRPLQVIIFKDILTSVGGGYREAAGQFRCPVKGLYQFHVTVFSGYNARVETELVVNTKSKVQLYSGGSKHGAASNTAILSLEEGDNVWVRLFRNRGEFIHSWSTFSGHLLALL